MEGCLFQPRSGGQAGPNLDILSLLAAAGESRCLSWSVLPRIKEICPVLELHSTKLVWASLLLCVCLCSRALAEGLPHRCCQGGSDTQTLDLGRMGQRQECFPASAVFCKASIGKPPFFSGLRLTPSLSLGLVVTLGKLPGESCPHSCFCKL